MRNLTYISLFSSAGVGCYGFKQVGFDCIATCELLAPRVEIQKANQKCKYETGYIVGDISKAEIKERLYAEIDFWNKHENIADVDVVIATPPCQGMSTANYKKKDETKRNSLVVEAISIIERVNPKVFVLENVSAFLKTVCTDVNGMPITISECMNNHLSSRYYLYAKVINFKDYGVPSSRPRTIVVGTRKDLINVSPLNIFPVKTKEITLREAICDLPSLEYGDMDELDIYHTFREYPQYMEEWISHIKEGESAFSNEEKYLPYKLVKGKKQTLKGAYMGNKFKRLVWDKPCACIATRNDQLASQSTIHPVDNRVLSIRELMRVMTIPADFKWTSENIEFFVNKAQKKAFLKKNELNIRRCIGEAVPTYIMFCIASRVKTILEFEDFVNDYHKRKGADINLATRNFYIDTFLAEQNLTNAKGTGAYYTPQSVVFEAISSYRYEEGQKLELLEPAVGLGAFLPQLFVLLQDCSAVNMDLCEIDSNTIGALKVHLEKLSYNKEIFKLNFIDEDFLISAKIKSKYDLIVSNPPFVDAEKSVLKIYRKQSGIDNLKNIFAFFLQKFFSLSNEIITILPKSFLMASEYDTVRKNAEKYGIVKIVDFGIKYFKKVFVEILSIHFKMNYCAFLNVESKLTNEIYRHEQKYIFHEKAWLIYRNEWFDEYISKLDLGVFNFFRDRQLTNKYLSKEGEIRVLRSKNITDNGDIIEIDGYDKYLNANLLEKFAVSKYINQNCIIMPNFTYNTRAAILPPNCIVNGSIAVLLPVKEEVKQRVDLSYYATENFRRYYAIIKNNAKFTINIDNNSIYYIGVLK